MTEPLSGMARLLRQCLAEGRRVEIERLGTFRPSRSGGFEFIPDRRPTVFLAYVEEDTPTVIKIYEFLDHLGFRPWMDKVKLLAGQNWPRAIEGAIETADFFIACLSRKSVSKRGTFQSEMRYALDCARRVPLDGIFFIPLRLEECRVPSSIRQHIQYVDAFPELEAGIARLVLTMNQEMLRREEQELLSSAS